MLRQSPSRRPSAHESPVNKSKKTVFMMAAAQCLVPKKRCINLAASDSMKTSRNMKDALETTHEITRLIKYSPVRDDMARNQMTTEMAEDRGHWHVMIRLRSVEADYGEEIGEKNQIFTEARRNVEANWEVF